MDIKEILIEYKKNRKSLEEVVQYLSLFSIKHIDNQIAQIDVDRSKRKNVPEIVLATHKKSDDLILILNAILKNNGYVLASKIKPRMMDKILKYYGGKKLKIDKGLNSTSLLIYDNESSLPKDRGGKVGIICAGTSDIGIAEEARLAARTMGCTCQLAYDVGIAGIHRLINSIVKMTSEKVDAIVAVAGMEGALPAVTASLVSVPVIGVPISVGYGYGSNGKGALASMLQTCSFGLVVVNIDNGIGGGIFASMIANKGKN